MADADVAGARAEAAASVVDALAPYLTDYNALVGSVTASQAALKTRLDALAAELAAANAKAPHARGGADAAGKLAAYTAKIDGMRRRVAVIAQTLAAVGGRVAHMQGLATLYESQQQQQQPKPAAAS